MTNSERTIVFGIALVIGVVLWNMPINGVSISSRAAAYMKLADSGNYFTSDNVEGALQEIGTGTVGGGDTAFEIDASDGLMPVTGAFAAIYFETDGNDDLTPKL